MSTPDIKPQGWPCASPPRAAEGISHQLKISPKASRGDQDIDTRLNQLGASIQRVSV